MFLHTLDQFGTLKLVLGLAFLLACILRWMIVCQGVILLCEAWLKCLSYFCKLSGFWVCVWATCLEDDGTWRRDSLGSRCELVKGRYSFKWWLLKGYLMFVVRLLVTWEVCNTWQFFCFKYWTDSTCQFKNSYLLVFMIKNSEILGEESWSIKDSNAKRITLTRVLLTKLWFLKVNW